MNGSTVRARLRQLVLVALLIGLGVGALLPPRPALAQGTGVAPPVVTVPPVVVGPIEVAPPGGLSKDSVAYSSWCSMMTGLGYTVCQGDDAPTVDGPPATFPVEDPDAEAAETAYRSARVADSNAKPIGYRILPGPYNELADAWVDNPVGKPNPTLGLVLDFDINLEPGFAGFRNLLSFEQARWGYEDSQSHVSLQVDNTGNMRIITNRCATTVPGTICNGEPGTLYWRENAVQVGGTTATGLLPSDWHHVTLVGGTGGCLGIFVDGAERSPICGAPLGHGPLDSTRVVWGGDIPPWVCEPNNCDDWSVGGAVGRIGNILAAHTLDNGGISPDTLAARFVGGFAGVATYGAEPSTFRGLPYPTDEPAPTTTTTTPALPTLPPASAVDADPAPIFGDPDPFPDPDPDPDGSVVRAIERIGEAIVNAINRLTSVTTDMEIWSTAQWRTIAEWQQARDEMVSQSQTQWTVDELWRLRNEIAVGNTNTATTLGAILGTLSSINTVARAIPGVIIDGVTKLFAPTVTMDELVETATAANPLPNPSPTIAPTPDPSDNVPDPQPGTSLLLPPLPPQAPPAAPPVTGIPPTIGAAVPAWGSQCGPSFYIPVVELTLRTPNPPETGCPGHGPGGSRTEADDLQGSVWGYRVPLRSLLALMLWVGVFFAIARAMPWSRSKEDLSDSMSAQGTT